MESKVITLPSKEKMLERLITVNDNAHLQEKFYPKLLMHAETEKVAMGVVMILQIASCEYTKGLPAVMTVVLNMNMPAFIDALVEDKEVAAEAKKGLEKVMAAAAAQ